MGRADSAFCTSSADAARCTDRNLQTHPVARRPGPPRDQRALLLALIDEDDQADAVRIHTHATLRYRPEGCGRWGALHRVRLVGDRAVCRDDVSRLAIPSPADVVGKSAARIVGENSTHARGTVKLSALAVPAPTREPRATAAPRPATAMSFFIVRDFFSFALFAECPVGPRSAQFPSASKANLAICPSRRLLPRRRTFGVTSPPRM